MLLTRPLARRLSVLSMLLFGLLAATSTHAQAMSGNQQAMSGNQQAMSGNQQQQAMSGNQELQGNPDVTSLDVSSALGKLGAEDVQGSTNQTFTNTTNGGGRGLLDERGVVDGCFFTGARAMRIDSSWVVHLTLYTLPCTHLMHLTTHHRRPPRRLLPGPCGRASLARLAAACLAAPFHRALLTTL